MGGPVHLRCFIACLVLVTLGGCEAGAAEHPLPHWILDAPGSDADGAVEVPVRLGERLPDRRSTYSLRTSAEIDPALRGRDLDLRVTPTSPSPSSNLTETGLLSGTPSYMAPELADDPSLLAPSSDVFSLGLVAHLVLTGEPAFDEPPLLRALRAAEPETPRSLGERVPPLAPSTVELLMRCLSHEPADRPSAGQVAAVLDDGLAG